MKTYLGDSVYAEFNGDVIVIYTNNGYGPQKVIVMETEVVDAFLVFIKKAKESFHENNN